MSSNMSATSGVATFPHFEVLPTALLEGLTNAAKASMLSTDTAGDLFNCMRGDKVPLNEIQPDAVIMIPLFAPLEPAVMDSSALAVGPIVYVQLAGPPQPRTIFGTCIAYSVDAGHRDIEIGARIHFPPPSHLLVVKPSALGLIQITVETPDDCASTDETRASKRLCVRSLEDMGEPADESRDSSIEKGMSKYILDLDGGKHATRNKSDIAKREKELGFAFRAVDRERWEFLAGTDFLLQSADYRTTIIQQGRMRAEHRHRAFLSCGVLDRIQSSNITQKTSDTKLFMTGQVLVEGDEPSLSLKDFLDGVDTVILSTCSSVCPDQNRPMIAVLKNLQVAMEVFLSNEYSGIFNDFIIALEGVHRPLELVAADFLKYSVEEALRKFFRAVSSERASTTLKETPLTNPIECATFLKYLFQELADDLADHRHRATEEEYFRMRIVRETRIAQKNTSSNKPKIKKESPAAKKGDTPSRPCAGHLGKQLKALYADGRPYKCFYGKACKFQHASKVGKTNEQLLEIIAQLPPTVQEDLQKAVRKTA